MSSKAPGEPSAAIRQRVIAARMLQDAMERMNMSAKVYDRCLWSRSHYRRP